MEGGVGIFFFSSRRRHTRYWRDWSSDVCSSDLILTAVQAEAAGRPVLVKIAPDLSDENVDAVADLALDLGLAGIIAKIGRASCRERVEISVGAVSLKKKAIPH